MGRARRFVRWKWKWKKKIRPNLSSLRVSAARVEPKFISLLHTQVFLLLSLSLSRIQGHTYVNQTYIFTYFFSHIHTRAHIYIYTCEHIFWRSLSLSLSQTHKWTRMHTHTSTNAFCHILSLTHTYRNTYTCAWTHTHARVPILMQTSQRSNHTSSWCSYSSHLQPTRKKPIWLIL